MRFSAIDILYRFVLVRYGKGCFTTKQILDNENAFLKISDNLMSQTNHFIAEKDVEFVCRDKILNEGQKKASKYILKSNDLSIMVGLAGTGKNYLLTVFRGAYGSQGYQINGAAISGKVADNLQKYTQIKSHMIAHYLIG
jgi:hypothetical protein